MALQKHHKAWLADHPARTEEWLRRMIAEGFEVHHIDGDHSNNHSKNLALLEVQDHRALHGLFRLSAREMMKYIQVRKAQIDYENKPISDAERRKRELVRRRAVGRNKSCPPALRSAIARKAAQTRWSKAHNGR